MEPRKSIHGTTIDGFVRIEDIPEENGISGKRDLSNEIAFPFRSSIRRGEK
jgi:hypothetical protein